MPIPGLILVHGPAAAAWMWEHWRRHLSSLGWEVNVLDLKGHGRSLPTDLGVVTMEDYLADLESVCSQIAVARGTHPVVGGWSMGGLLALMYAAKHPETPGVLLFSPDQPLEVAGRASIEEQRRHSGAVLGPEAFDVYPGDPAATRAAHPDLSDDALITLLEHSAGAEESGLAHRQRLRGISVPGGSVESPSLVLYGGLEGGVAIENYVSLAASLKGQSLELDDAGRWGIILNETSVSATAPRVHAWLREQFV